METVPLCHGERRLFDVCGSVTTPKIKLDLCDDGLYPYVTTQAIDNGVFGYSDVYTEQGGVLTIDSAVLGSCFYQSQNFTASDHVEKLVPRFNMTEHIALFLCAVVNQMGLYLNYSYASKRSQTALKSEYVVLPATPTGEPDWDYMENYMKAVMEREEVFAEHLASLTAEAVADGHEIDVSAWGEFRVGDLFEVLLPKGDMQPKLLMEGDIPLVSAGNENNGIVMLVDRNGDGVSQMFEAHCITVSMFGQAFYQSEPFYAVSHGRVNVLKSQTDLNELQGIFMAVILTSQLCQKYDFATMCNQSRLRDEIIHLPVTQSGEPDWAYMEQFMQQQIDKSQKLVEHLDSIWNN